MKKFFAILFFTLCFAGAAHAADDSPGLFESWFAAMGRTLKTPTGIDIYRPVWVYHMRWNYSKEQIDRYNEKPGGLGFGVNRVEGYREHSFSALVFTDSNYYTQGVLGYGWLARLYEPGTFFNIGGGFTITMQMRHEYYYIPLPLPLPLAGVDIGPLALQTAYVPGWPGMGNVAIIWLRLTVPI